MMFRLGILGFALFYFLYSRSVISEEYYFRFFGVFLMLTLQLILVLLCIASKVRQLFQEYNFKITLIPDSVENDPTKLNWKVYPRDELFMNRYTEEGKIALRTNEAKQRFQEEYKFVHAAQQSEISFGPLSVHIQNIQSLLQTLDKCRNIMNNFNIYPNEFGHALSAICYSNELSFVKVQQHHSCTIDVDQITDNEQQLLKNNKINGGNTLRLPGWGDLVTFFSQMGTTLKNYLKQMHESNIKFITLSYRKIEQQDQILCSQITSLEKEIEDTKKILVELTEEERKTTKAQQYEQLQPETAEAHQKWLYWLKKRYLEFINLEQSIKTNEIKLKVMRQKVKHYRQNLNLLLKKHRNTHNAVLKISLRGYLDSVYNSLERSIELFNTTLESQHIYKKREKTKVQHLKISSNVQQMILAEKKYQRQFMERVDIQIGQAQLIEKGILDLQSFLQSLIYAYQQFEIRIKTLTEDYIKQQLAKFHVRIFEAFSQTNNKFIVQLETFSKVNKKFIDINIHQLRVVISKIIRYKQTAEYQLADLERQSVTQNVIYKYKTVQERLLSYYECLDEHIESTMKFRKLYLKHSNRIKKSMLLFIYEKLMDQKKVVQNLIMSVDSKAFQRQISHIDIDLSHHDLKTLELEEEGEKEEEGQEGEDKQEEHVSHEFLECLNKLLFACYTEWSVSHFFKTNIHDSLYGALNGESSEDFTEILMNSIDFSGPPPRLNSLKQLKSEEQECLFELNLSFYGSISLEITTSYPIFQSVIPISVRAHITEMNMTVRICFVIGEKGSGWFSFIGEPAARIDVVPVVGNFTIDYAAVRKLIQSFIMNLLKKNVYPMKSQLRVPMYGQIKEEKKK